jgi:nitroreductase
MKNIIEALNWRYATKKFDQNKKIKQEDLDVLLEALRLSPSSYGLQPWKFILVKNKEMREKIRSVVAYNQPQITDASEMIVFANKKNIDNNLVDEYLQFVSKENNVDLDKLQGLGDMIKGSFSGKSNEELKGWAARQLYLAAGVLITSCAVSSIDACPMEGFDSAKLDELLGLSSLGLESKMIVTMGYRSEDDASLSHKKVRFGKDDVFINID